jgi:hypothetical protein
MQTRPSTSSQQPSARQRLRAFASLAWYEGVITFLFTFAAKTSEVLVAVGLIISTASFLTDGNVMGKNAGLATAWAWVQALAIDSSLGVTSSSVFSALKQRDWLKALCYSLLTGLLAVVAGTITNIDTLSHVTHSSITSATLQLGLNVKFLATLRSIAVVGFILMSRLKGVSFKDWYNTSSATSPSSPQISSTPEETKRTIALVQQIMAEMLAQQGRRVVVEEQETSSPSMLPPEQASKQQESRVISPFPSEESQELSPEERDARLAHVYQELEAEGKRISGRALAARAHMRRSTCNQWLAVRHPELAHEDSEEHTEHAPRQGDEP